MAAIRCWLLLADDGDFSAKPELEIFAAAVQCGHGATVADTDGSQVTHASTDHRHDEIRITAPAAAIGAKPCSRTRIAYSLE
jgi:hypothetical protein